MARSRSPFRSLLTALALCLGVWWVLGIPIMMQVYETNAARSPDRAWISVLHPFVRYSIFGLLTLPVIAWTRRNPFQREGFLRAVAAHVVGFPLFFLTWSALRYLSYEILPIAERPSFSGFMAWTWRTSRIEQFWAYAAIVVAGHAILYSRAAREREVAAAELRAEIARQHVEILRLQLHPHFLFNALHGISALMDRDVEKARTALAHFSDLLRRVLDHGSADEVRVREELEFVEAYLELERIRLTDRLQSSIRVDEEALGALIPAMLLQILVENAVRHGIERRLSPGGVEIEVRAESSRLRIAVVNDAPPQTERPGTGIGLSNTRLRLSAMYGEHSSVDIRRLKDGKVEVVVEIPLRRSETLAELAS